LIPAEVLAAVESQTGKPIASLFHMIAGTSTGGILAAGFCRPPQPLTANNLVDFYKTPGPSVFANPWWRKLRTVGSFAYPEFDPKPLERALATHFGSARLSDIKSADLLVTAYDIDTPDPLFFKSWKAAGTSIDPSDRPKDVDFALRDVCRATSAAPTYYPPAQIFSTSGKAYHLVDGVVFADNPAMCAVHAAMRLYPKADSYLVVSLGTGAHQRPVPYKKARSWGKLEWIMNRDIIEIVFDGVSSTVNYEIRQMFGSGHVDGNLFRFETPLRTGATDPHPVSDSIFDVSTRNLANLRHKAHQLIRDNAASFDALIAQLREDPVPRHQLV
jgi:predicted acylesterase/phospholipase RssA